MKAKSISEALMEEMGYHEDEKVDEWTAFSPSSWFNNRDYGDDTSRDDARQQDADKAAQQALAAAAPRGGLDSEGDGKPEWAMNLGGVPAAGSAAPTPPVYTPGPVQQASQGRANDDATGVAAAITRAEIERAEAAAAAANKPPAPVKPGIDWSKGKEEQPLTYKPPGTTPAATPGTIPAPSISTQPVNPSNRPPSLGNDTVDPKKSQTRKEIKDLLAKLKGGGGAGPGPIDQRPVPSGNKIEAMQKELLAAGANLGTFGPNGDGIDGKIGNKTREAMKKFPAIAAKYGVGGTTPSATGGTTPSTTGGTANSKNDEVKKQIANLIGQLKGKPDTTPINISSGASFSPPFRTPPTVGESVNSEDDRILNQIKNVRF
jgi:hypothetical protein